MYYRDQTEETGYIAKPVVSELGTDHQMLTGKILAESLSEVGTGIDLAILDTVHQPSGELLDVILLLPLMNEYCVILLHDIGHHFRTRNYKTYCTLQVMASAVGQKIYL